LSNKLKASLKSTICSSLRTCAMVCFVFEREIERKRKE
jgi:hypothetical protein